MRCAVDTNVLIVANGRDSNASPHCRLATVDFLADLMKSGRLVIDDAGLVEEEYRKNIDLGQPGVGNLFFQQFIGSASNRLERISLKKDKNGAFVDFPPASALKKFDPSDRKFVALACKAKCSVANATDTDWLDDKAELEKNGVKLHFICGCNKAEWFK